MKLDFVWCLQNGLRTVRNNPKILVPSLLSAVVWVIVAVVTSSVAAWLEDPVVLSTVDQAEILQLLIGLVVVWVVLGTVAFYLDMVTIRVVADVILAGDTRLKDAALFTLKKFPVVIAAATLVLFIVFPASILLIPGVYIGIRLMFFSYAILIDNEGVIDSLKKSWSIVKGNWWRTFVLLVILSVVGGIFSFLIDASAYFDVAIALTMMAIATVGLMFVRAWQASALTHAYLQLAPEPEGQEVEDEEEDESTSPEQEAEEGEEEETSVEQNTADSGQAPEHEQKQGESVEENKVGNASNTSSDKAENDISQIEAMLIEEAVKTSEELKKDRVDETEKEKSATEEPVQDDAEKNVEVEGPEKTKQKEETSAESKEDSAVPTKEEDATKDDVKINGLGKKKGRKKTRSKSTEESKDQENKATQAEEMGAGQEIKEDDLDGISLIIRKEGG